MIQCSSLREEVQSAYLEPGSLRTVPDDSFVTRDIFKRNDTQSYIISQRVYGAPPFSPTINRPPRLICMYNVKRFHAAVK